LEKELNIFTDKKHLKKKVILFTRMTFSGKNSYLNFIRRFLNTNDVQAIFLIFI